MKKTASTNLTSTATENFFTNKLNLIKKTISRMILMLLTGLILITSVFAMQGGSNKNNTNYTNTLAKAGSGGKCPTPPPPPSDTKCYSGSGCLDTTFDYDGLVNTNLNSSSGNSIKKIITQPDGKIVAVGEINNSNSATDFFVIRYNADGSLDSSFGDFDPANPILRRGYTSIVFSSNNDWVQAGAWQADGKILIGGASNGSGAIARINSDGTLDNTFDGDGKLLINSPLTFIKAIAIQSDGKILVGGAGNFTVARINTDGSLDTTFGTGGKVSLNPSSSSSGSGGLWAMSIQRIPAGSGEERIVLGGNAASSSRAVATFALMRLKSNGSLDVGFGSSGRILTSFYDNSDQLRSLGIDSANRIVAGGLVYAPSSSCTGADFGLARYTENGILDTTFSGDGKVNVDIYGGTDYQYGLALQTDDKPVLGGIAYYTNASGTNVSDFALVRFNTDGSLDSTFGPGFLGGGIVTTRFPGETSSYLYTLAQQADGKILAGGTSNVKLLIARYFQ